MAYVYVATTIILTIYGQIVIKWRMSIKGGLPDGTLEKIIFLVTNLFDPWIMSGLFGAGIAALAWMAAMTKLDLSHAYPFVSITFPAVVILSYFFFNEPLSIHKIIGLALIVVGVITTSQG